MKLKFLLPLLLLLSLAVTAQELDSYNLEILLKASGLAHQKIQSTFSLTQNTNEILFLVDQEMQNVNVYTDKTLDFAVTDKGLLINWNLEANSENMINIEFDSNDLVKQSGKNFIFSLDLSSYNPKSSSIKLTLPEGFILADVESPVSPKPVEVETDGRLISIVWDTNSKKESFIVIYKRGIENQDPLVPLYMALSSLIIILIAVSIVLVNRRKTKQFISETISGDENKIVDIIRKDRAITQKKISELTGFSKSKMSKLARRLEEKGIIKKKPFFKTNKFDLSKRLK